MQNKIYSMLGLATKAGKTVSGEFPTEKAIKEEEAKLVLVAEDASDNTKKHFFDMCNYRSIPAYVFGEKDALNCVVRILRQQPDGDGYIYGCEIVGAASIMDYVINDYASTLDE